MALKGKLEKKKHLYRVKLGWIVDSNAENAEKSNEASVTAKTAVVTNTKQIKIN